MSETSFLPVWRHFPSEGRYSTRRQVRLCWVGGGERLLGLRNSEDLLTSDRALFSTNKAPERSLVPYPHPAFSRPVDSD